MFFFVISPKFIIFKKTASGRSKGSQLMAVRAGYVDSEVTSQSEDERGLNYVVRGPLNYNEFQVAKG